jgi:cell division septum initiation protein DivIVA
MKYGKMKALVRDLQEVLDVAESYSQAEFDLKELATLKLKYHTEIEDLRQTLKNYKVNNDAVKDSYEKFRAEVEDAEKAAEGASAVILKEAAKDAAKLLSKTRADAQAIMKNATAFKKDELAKLDAARTEYNAVMKQTEAVRKELAALKAKFGG